MNRFPPVGSIEFCVGASGGADVGAGVSGGAVVVVVVVVVVVLDGASCLSLEPHAAVRPPSAIRAAQPAVIPRRRTNTCEAMTSIPCGRST